MSIQAVIHLTQGRHALVDYADIDLAAFKWYARGHQYPYATRQIPKPAGESGWRQRSIVLHRVIMQRIAGRELLKGEFVDHINNDTLDNRRCNLRIASPAENTMNMRGHAKSGYKGAYWHTTNQKWQSQIVKHGVLTWLGLFDTPEEAHQAYVEASRELHGEFSNTKHLGGTANG